MHHYQPRHMLVTGGAGFIGANFIHHILETTNNIKIINLDKLTYASNIKNLASLKHTERYQFVHGDITDSYLVNEVLRKHNIDTIVHFAAESHVDNSIAQPAVFIQTNVIGTFALLEAAKNYWQHENHWDATRCRFHHISTDEVYGSLQLDDASFTEKTPYHPRSPYSASKAGSDHLVYAYYHTYGLPITLSNCSNNYGPFQHNEKFIPTIIKGCLTWQPIPVYGEGKNIRDWLYVKDHCKGIQAILEQGQVGERYNLGGNQEMENLSLVRLICHYFDKHKPQKMPYASLVQFVTDRKGHDFRYAINHEKIKKLLDWTPEETFLSGLEKTILATGNL